MKKLNVQYEILLLTDTTFSERQCNKNDDTGYHQQLSKSEQLEEACWDGLLDELLPQIAKRPIPGNKLFLLSIRNGESFLQMDLSELPGELERPFSIDANLFLTEMLLN